MYDLRPILLVNGALLTTLGLSMLVPFFVDLAEGNPDWAVFAAAGGTTIFIGMGLVFTNRAGRMAMTGLSVPQAFILTVSSWISITAFAALPLAFSELDLNYTDAFFEAMSGLTTTGATVIVGLDDAPPGILVWRALLQWLGGIGIIVMAIAIMPMLQVGGMQLFRMESSDNSEKIVPRAAQMATGIFWIYIGLTAACAFFYSISGMGSFDAITHSMTTLATGGYSTHDASISHFQSAPIEWTAITFMTIGGLPFTVFLVMTRGNFRAFFKDEQIQWFIGLLLLGGSTMWLYHQFGPGPHEIEGAFRHSMFTAATLMSGTGYGSIDYGSWGPFSNTLALFLMFVGGCAGSASCGVKIFRVKVLATMIWTDLRRAIYPSGVFRVRFNGRPVARSAMQSVTSFLFMYLVIFAVIVAALAAVGLDPQTALSGAAGTLNNVGPGLGPVIGPTGTYASLNDAAKWIMSAAMLIGRLELFTVLVIFTNKFWRG